VAQLYFPLKIAPQLAGKEGVGELFTSYRGNAEGNFGGNSFFSELAESVNKGDITFSCCLREPIHSVRPSTMGKDIRDMGMKDYGKIANWSFQNKSPLF